MQNQTTISKSLRVPDFQWVVLTEHRVICTVSCQWTFDYRLCSDLPTCHPISGTCVSFVEISFRCFVLPGSWNTQRRKSSAGHEKKFKLHIKLCFLIFWLAPIALLSASMERRVSGALESLRRTSMNHVCLTWTCSAMFYFLWQHDLFTSSSCARTQLHICKLGHHFLVYISMINAFPRIIRITFHYNVLPLIVVKLFPMILCHLDMRLLLFT